MNKLRYFIWWLFYIGEHQPVYDGVLSEWLPSYMWPQYGIPKYAMDDTSHGKETATEIGLLR